MKAGDIVQLDMDTVGNLWGASTALITKVHIVPSGCGQIHLLVSGGIMGSGTIATIPWLTRHKYIEKVLSPANNLNNDESHSSN